MISVEGDPRSEGPSHDFPLASSLASRSWAAALFVVGLAIRFALIPSHGTPDMDYYLQWGRQACDLGLTKGTFNLPYFPGENQLLQLAAWCSVSFKISGYAVIKSINLGFDLAIFLTLRKLFRIRQVNPAKALVYWLHPYVLTLFSLGFLDFHQAFFALAAVLISELWKDSIGYLLAGVPLGFALLMKGQAVSILVIVCLYIGMKIYVRRDWTSLWRGTGLWLSAPLALFGAYTLFFRFHGGSWWYLGRMYWRVVRNPYVVQSLNAHMPNIWYVVAYHLRKGQDPVWTVMEPSALHWLASGLTTAIFAWFALLLAKQATTRRPYSELFYLSAWSTLVFPMTLTRVHENYMFIGSVFAFGLLGLIRNQQVRWAIHAFLAVQFINLFGIYGLGRGDLSNSAWVRWTCSLYVEPVRYVLALVSMGLFLFLGRGLVRWTRNAEDPRSPAESRNVPGESVTPA